MFIRLLFIGSMHGMAGNTRDRTPTAMRSGVTVTAIGDVKVIDCLVGILEPLGQLDWGLYFFLN
jgi:hypothetical protein